MNDSIVIMGVAGCGKSSLGAAVASACGLRLIEGDDHHSAASRAKMQGGIALTDADRDGWLTTLGAALNTSPLGATLNTTCPQGVVLTCSALKRSYRDRLRRAAPGLRFVYLDISRVDALARVQARAATHFFSTSLVDSQFDTLEAPIGEAGVLRVDAREPISQLSARVVDWLRTLQATPQPTRTEPA